MRIVWKLTILAVLSSSFMAAMCTPTAPAQDLRGLFDTVLNAKRIVFEHKKPHALHNRSVEDLAKQIDWLEHHVESYGTVVAKQPDVWGEARMTKHRQEYEREIVKRFKEDKFENTLQAAIRRSDQSFLSMALTLGSGTGAGGSLGSNGAVSLINTGAADLGDIARTAGQPLQLSRFGVAADGGTAALSLEPTIMVDQLSRYLNHLNQLRRINEGDDTADSPGYALNLVRIPVSVLPGKRTRKGYGAEITVTAEPYLTEELLSDTFCDLVINDIVDQFAMGITKALEDEDAIEELADALHVWASKPIPPQDPAKPESMTRYKEEFCQWKKEHEATINRHQRAVQKRPVQNYAKALRAAKIAWQARKSHYEDLPGDVLDEVEKAYVNVYVASISYEEAFVASSFLGVARSRRSLLAFPRSQVTDIFGVQHVLGYVVVEANRVLRSRIKELKQVHLSDTQRFLREELEAAYEFLSLPQNRHFWHSHCTPRLAEAVRNRARFLQFKPPDGGVPLTKLRGRYFEDIDRYHPRATYTATASLGWAIIVESALLNKRLIEDMDKIATEKGCLCGPVAHLKFYLPKPRPPRPGDPSQCQEQYAQWLAEYREAAEAFNQYVRCRWPIHVFALDPVTQDQNVAEVFSRRRELQLAVAVAVAQGQMNVEAAGRFVRRLETDMETIALNRTAVAFSHASDTFGWRFYPRVQTPPTPGTLGAFGETLLGGPTRDQDMRQRELEAGMRECVAIVIMPSFVPYVTFETRANWFGLTNPRKKELTLTDAMRLSRNYQAIQTSLQQICHAGIYRPEDIDGLVRTVDQLERRMPLQKMLVEVPYENTLGGFEMFTAGVTDLGPELVGWYGAPGVLLGDNAGAANPGEEKKPEEATGADAAKEGAAKTEEKKKEEEEETCTCAGTTLFLVGDNFSVHDTRVIAGGVCIPNPILLSRQVMRVTIPACAHAIVDTKDGKPEIDVHIATPYGVSSHLLIPVVRKKPSKAVLAQATAAAKKAAAEEFKKLQQESQVTFDWKNSLTVWFEYGRVKDKDVDTINVYLDRDPSTLKFQFRHYYRDKAKGKIPEKIRLGVAIRHGEEYVTSALRLGEDKCPMNPDGMVKIDAKYFFHKIDDELRSKITRKTIGDRQLLELKGVFFLLPSDRKGLPIKVEGPLPINLRLLPDKRGGGKQEGNHAQQQESTKAAAIRFPAPDAARIPISSDSPNAPDSVQGGRTANGHPTVGVP